MAYVVDLFPIELAQGGGFVGTGPALRGFFTNLFPPTVDMAAASAAAPTRLNFTLGNAPPPGAVTLLVGNTGPVGDLYRSGFLATMPPSPGTVTVISFPTTATTLSSSALTAMAAGVTPIPFRAPGWLDWLVGILSLGMFIPISGTITSLVPTVGSPPGGVTFTASGVFTIRVGYFTVQPMFFTGTIVATPAPSGDPTQPSRILSVACTTSLGVATIGPSLAVAMAGVFLMMLSPSFAGLATSFLEPAVNGAIASLVAPALASRGFRATPTSVLSARSVTVGTGGIRLALVLADLFGPAVIPIPGNLNASVAPAPVAGAQRVYTVTVTNSATGAPVDQAVVTLHNYATNGAAQDVSPGETDMNGQVTFGVALNPKISIQVITGDGERERIRVFASPTMTVAKAGFNTLNVRLL